MKDRRYIIMIMTLMVLCFCAGCGVESNIDTTPKGNETSYVNSDTESKKTETSERPSVSNIESETHEEEITESEKTSEEVEDGTMVYEYHSKLYNEDDTISVYIIRLEFSTKTPSEGGTISVSGAKHSTIFSTSVDEGESQHEKKDESECVFHYNPNTKTVEITLESFDVLGEGGGLATMLLWKEDGTLIDRSGGDDLKKVK